MTMFYLAFTAYFLLIIGNVVVMEFTRITKQLAAYRMMEEFNATHTMIVERYHTEIVKVRHTVRLDEYMLEREWCKEQLQYNPHFVKHLHKEFEHQLAHNLGKYIIYSTTDDHDRFAHYHPHQEITAELWIVKPNLENEHNRIHLRNPDKGHYFGL